MTRRLVGEWKAEGEEAGEDACDKRLAIAQPLQGGGCMLEIPGEGSVCASLASGVAPGASSGQGVGASDDPRWG